MGEITMVVGSIALFAGGFVGWYTVWHRRVESAFERVRVDGRRTAHVLRQDVYLDDVASRLDAA